MDSKLFTVFIGTLSKITIPITITKNKNNPSYNYQNIWLFIAGSLHKLQH